MAKKKKKEKKKIEEKVPNYTLDNILKSSKKTESTLQGLLKAFTEDKGFISPKEEEKISPQLSYETKKKIAEDYMIEEVPLTERKPLQKREPLPKVPEEKEIPTVEVPTPASSTIKTPSFSKKDDIYVKLSDFFEEIFIGYVDRYNQWENSISSILSILRKMRKITKKNTEDLSTTINNLYDKIRYNLEQFKVKREEVEKVAGVDIESMSSEFKMVLGLLELQVKEYQLKKLSDEYIHQQQTFS
ncbi:MAG: hypothetical protein CEE42_05935 [Promethearchaeota archaeon Loki_b31]|nr:MAG: hypothetical protein CEE42_05935 [Candidatus Lokiarchaeota archaeon Loki_b31]